MEKNQLYYGDNLEVLRQHIKDESVDLIYLDPPFNSRQDYNVLFAEKDGTRSSSQIMAFEDTWEWNVDAERAYEEIVERGGRVSDATRAFRTFLGHSDMMAYLAMMAPRLVELKRVLKVTGSIYLHCDPTASHYLKMLMDAIFGPQYFQNEIIWKRTHAHGSSKRYGPVHDTVLFFSNSDSYVWTDLRVGHDPLYITKHFKMVDEKTKRNFAPITLTGSGIRHGESGKPWHGVDPTRVKRHWALPGKIIHELGILGDSVQAKLDALDAAGMLYWPEKSDESGFGGLFQHGLGGRFHADEHADLRFFAFDDATQVAHYKPPGLEDRYPRLQVLTIEELLAGKRVEYPRLLEVTFKKAPKARPAAEKNGQLQFDSAEEDEGPF